ncbi:M23 family metallopeptidase [Parvibium lacunae]|uniref:DD-carboxypeptidase/endopeptidase Mpg n=1 Tax=Parvibium lacunae TaxID=1888893 RepID=A0A368L056_9BURK|nr:peptidoglycan DD-metalloendopeptidase family protein [Parvibium lacunae]RCS56774.1 M23 family peptidase [Parvibium lacunae]
MRLPVLNFVFNGSALRALFSSLLGHEKRVDWRQLRQDRRVQFFALLFAIPVFGAVAAYSVAPAEHEPLIGLPPSQVAALPLALPPLAVAEELTPLYPLRRPTPFIQEETIRRGDTLASLLWRLGVRDPDAESFIKRDTIARNLLQLRPGRSVQAHTDSNGLLQKLRYFHTPAAADARQEGAGAASRLLEIERLGQGNLWQAKEVEIQNERRVEMRRADIRSSLFAATDAANIPDGIATQLAELFSGEIDFHKDLRRGDHFRVLYEAFYQQGDFVRAGRILAAEFNNGGKTIQAFWFAEPGERGQTGTHGAYYTAEGRSLKRQFLRSPLEFSRVTSGFTSARFHPILQTWRAHKGVDYAAPVGTPIRAVADGVVETAGVKGGYGNVLILKHGGQYSTVYAHLNSFARGLRKGAKVRQGDLIGYVGQTGWATGPHLHYEFRVNDEPRNPLAIALPQAQPLLGMRLLNFQQQARGQQQQLNLLNQTTLVALE